MANEFSLFLSLPFLAAAEAHSGFSQESLQQITTTSGLLLEQQPGRRANTAANWWARYKLLPFH